MTGFESEGSEKSTKSVKSDSLETTSTKVNVTRYVTAVGESSFVPKNIQPHILKAAPHIGRAVELLESLIPIIQAYYEKAVALWKKLEPYRPELLIPSFIGLVMCFFGGNFLTLIAAIEAYKMCGYETTLNCINNLIDDFKKVADANKKG